MQKSTLGQVTTDLSSFTTTAVSDTKLGGKPSVLLDGQTQTAWATNYWIFTRKGITARKVTNGSRIGASPKGAIIPGQANFMITTRRSPSIFGLE